MASITEDVNGNIWFGSITSDFPPIKEGGLSRYDGKSFTRFEDVKGLTANDIYTVYALRSGQVWVGAVGVGAYRYDPSTALKTDGSAFTLFDRTERPELTRYFGVQAVLEDSKGTLWFGFSGGLVPLQRNALRERDARWAVARTMKPNWPAQNISGDV